jgi:hypothetical protein
VTAIAVVLILAVRRETSMIAAFASLAGSGVIVSVGAWILLIRERRAARRQRED